MRTSDLVRKTIYALTVLLHMLALSFSSRGAAGDVDLSFDAGSRINDRVNAIVLQPDGRVIIGGSFTIVNGLLRRGVARLNADGSGDSTFVDRGPNEYINYVSELATQADGKVLVGYESGVARLNSDGTPDPTFQPPLVVDDNLIPTGVGAIALQADGKILIGGRFAIVNEKLRSCIARLNSDGTLDTSFNPGGGVIGPFPSVSDIALQTDGKLLIAGTFAGYHQTYRYNLARLNGDGSLDESFDAHLADAGGVYQVVVQPDGKALFGGAFGLVNGIERRSIARVNADGSLDTGFNPGTGLDGGHVSAMALQPNGRVLVGGYFLSVNGTPRNRLARFNADGSLDSTFNRTEASAVDVVALAVQADGKVLVGGADLIGGGSVPPDVLTRVNVDGARDVSFTAGGGINSSVTALLQQPDGKALISGEFISISGVERNGIARLNPNGSLDGATFERLGSFGPVTAIALQGDGKIIIGTGNSVTRVHPDGARDHTFDAGGGQEAITALAVQPDGKIVLGGFVRSVVQEDDGSLTLYHRLYLSRRHANGSLDTTFQQTLGPSAQDRYFVTSLAVQADGKIVVAGYFFTFQGVAHTGIARVSDDGTLDPGFAAESNGSVSSVALQSDGRILMVGEFTVVHGTSRRRIARLNSNGALDTAFNPGTGADSQVLSVALQPNGKALITGHFTDINDTSRARIARLNSDGSLDLGFNPGTGADGAVYGAAFQSDGGILIGGAFTIVNGIVRPRVARLLGDAVPATPSFTVIRSEKSMSLSWPLTSRSFQLQERADLGVTDAWSPASTSAVTNAGQVTVTVPTSAGIKFYRLQSP